MVAAAWEEEPATLNLPKKLFHCAACRAPLKPPVFKCDKEHFVCCACGRNGGGDGATKHCGPCGHDVSYAHSAFMDSVVGAYKVPCTYKHHGCASSIVYHAAAEHNDKCAHAPCYCLECTPPFEGSPAQLLRHLTAPSGKHSWPMDKIKYEANTDADTRPVYTGVLWVDGPPAPPGQLMCTFRHQATMASCSVPGEVDMEQGWLHAHVNPSMLHGESGEVHLRLRITKFP
ncbi:putative E3 ubiquitin-protein ligase SINA-like 6 [Hordeum vulgare subsp. vulgare]|uniref:putative E3 ubiquitin-protein ligase SINA-like 6 n=1 Tax=Hordeum vulgare subsp. vulgare TaxID=112509 RepID=UPI001D1A5672|nr:putative E3 ubiquitin-protein ligase SINA-like 6 [Hordeum vulgare subsp. vulgare]XP_044971896.1 putative E3 ubiquitin-protein ligase SINA-like 6 [Hordeum vulgare subsp. vulgare]